ncbi:MAG: DNA polymerase III subunit alpha [Acidobacteria bacterium]|nr:DNA polymerase III subunit alpha [Acidobacteriota bacterium]
MSDFAHLHLHSQYSLLDGANRLDDVLERAKAGGMPAVALTDHGNMFGAIEFYKKARKIGVKPILGIEAYVAQGSRLDRDSTRRSNNHLVLLVQNETGMRNLIKLTSASYLEGFYYKPRIDHELLRRHSEGLICLSACLKGEVNERITAGKIDDAEQIVRDYIDIFGQDNYFLELQDHGIPEQRQANEVLRSLAKRNGVRLVVTNDCHYLEQDDSRAHDILLCIGTQRNVDDPDRLRYASDQFYLKSADEMYRVFPNDAQAIENTVAIAERCALEIDMGSFHLPDFPVPSGQTLDSYLTQVTDEGLEGRLLELRRRGSSMLQESGEQVYRERLASELAVIRDMGFAGYFLIVWDFVRYARENQVPVGPGRGSAAGSLVAYSLRVTDIDPLQYGLFFERFLNPGRISLPDIDIDFCMRRRSEIIQYVSDKYGRDRVAQIITFGTLGAKAVIRDVGRVMGLPYGKVDRIAKLVPDMTKSLSEALDAVPALRQEAADDAEISEVLEIGTRLEGLTRHASLHAAGVVIAPRRIDEFAPLYKTNKGEIVTQWDKDVIEDLGLLKMDFLGLRTLTVIDDTVKMLAHEGIELDLDELPLDDAETFRLFCEARSSGVFQFESSGMRELLRQVQPSRFEDLAALNALYRPGALEGGTVKQFVERKQGKKKTSYLVPQLEPILEETYGIIVYQEQVMRIAQEVAGFSMAEGDLLRKAMGKKIASVMKEQKGKFIDGAVGNGVQRRIALRLWDYIAPFAGYGFNKSHSVAYAMLAYKTAYLKAHYPVTFMAAMLTSEMSSKDNVAKYIRECREMGIPVLPPDVNESSWSFSSVGEAIRFGLGGVKGVGEAAVEAILETRHQIGCFTSLTHFATSIDFQALNSKVFDSLIKAGAFDGFGAPRRALIHVLDEVLAHAQHRQREIAQGQGTLFGGDEIPQPEPDVTLEPWPERERLRFEKEALGLYLTGNPLSEYREQLAALSCKTISQLEGDGDRKVTVAGVVSGLRQTKIKSGRNAGRIMGRFLLEDLEGSLPVAVFADQFETFGSLLEEDAMVLVKGVARDRGSGLEMTVDELIPLDRAKEDLITELEVELDGDMSSGSLVALRELLIEHAGDIPVRFRVAVNGKVVRIAPPDRFRVCYKRELVESIEALVGRGRVRRLGLGGEN